MTFKTRFVCNVCGYESGKWYGRCPSCSNWNSFEELRIQTSKKGFAQNSLNIKELKLEKASQIKTTSQIRISTGFEEFDRVLGGGIVSGSVILLSGDPGIGKSTLLLQLALNISGKIILNNEKNNKNKKDNRHADLPSDGISASHENKTDGILKQVQNDKRKVFYITGEESSSQVRLRAERLIASNELEKCELFIVSDTDIDNVMALLKQHKPSLVIIDSVQTLQSQNYPGFPGSIPQIRNVCSQVISFAKTENIPVFLIGHITKEGIAAGPMLLSHMVDAVLYLEGEKLSGTRILRAFKNRFGNSDEVGIFIMEERGLVEIKDAANFFIDKRTDAVSGSCVAVVMEGSRPLLVEVQALSVPSSLSFSRRVATGIQEKRLELLLAVIQKHAKIPIDKLDVFVNVVGGLKVLETSIDLAACIAIISSYKNLPVPPTVAISEVGLLGELRPVMNLDKRISEARKFGFKNIITSKDHKSLSQVVSNM